MPRHLSSRRDRPRIPLDAKALEALALHYVGRYATTRAKLVSYLERKLRERGWEGDATPDPGAIGERCAALGYIDDRGFASARAASLTRRGFGERRVRATLRAAGVDDADTADARAIATLIRAGHDFALARRIAGAAPGEEIDGI